MHLLFATSIVPDGALASGYEIANAAIIAAVGWRPHYDDLDTIVTHALAWERHLARRNDTLR